MFEFGNLNHCDGNCTFAVYNKVQYGTTLSYTAYTVLYCYIRAKKLPYRVRLYTVLYCPIRPKIKSSGFKNYPMAGPRTNEVSKIPM